MKSISVLIIALIGGIVVQSWMDSRKIGVSAFSDESLYFQSGETLKKASIGFDGLLADVYWIRTIQYFGEKLEAQRQTKDALDLREMPQLESLLNITTELDPHHLAAYRFGGFFLRFLDSEKAIRFMRTGIRNNPGEWRLYQDLGYIFWRENRYREAAGAYATGSNLTGAPAWMKAMSVTMLERGGDRETASEMLRRLCEGNDDPFIQEICRRQDVKKQ
jgi:hypothetical protein